MRKTLSIASIFALVGLALTACGGGAEDVKPKDIRTAAKAAKHAAKAIKAAKNKGGKGKKAKR